jgi:hypothetical protein
MLLKHKAMKDVAFEVFYQETEPSTGKLVLGVLWWNIGDCHSPYPMNVMEHISVQPEWLDDVEEYVR